MAARGPLRPIQLHHLLVLGGQKPGQSRTVATGALDCPHPMTMVLTGQLQELPVAVGVAGTVMVTVVWPVAVATTAAVWVCLWVSTPMTSSTSSASMCIALAPCPDADVVGAGPRRSTAGL
jgi:hypothetical protein